MAFLFAGVLAAIEFSLALVLTVERPDPLIHVRSMVTSL